LIKVSLTRTRISTAGWHGKATTETHGATSAGHQREPAHRQRQEINPLEDRTVEPPNSAVAILLSPKRPSPVSFHHSFNHASTVPQLGGEGPPQMTRSHRPSRGVASYCSARARARARAARSCSHAHARAFILHLAGACRHAGTKLLCATVIAERNFIVLLSTGVFDLPQSQPSPRAALSPVKPLACPSSAVHVFCVDLRCVYCSSTYCATRLRWATHFAPQMRVYAAGPFFAFSQVIGRLPGGDLVDGATGKPPKVPNESSFVSPIIM